MYPSPYRDKDDSCVEIHSNEGRIEDYEIMSEATTWSGDASDKGISDNSIPRGHGLHFLMVHSHLVLMTGLYEGPPQLSL
jgi:hypothetical protein